MTTLLEVKELNVFYKKLHAVNQVSFFLKEGTSLGLVGESGSGKSTIAHSIVGLIPNYTGSISFLGKEVKNSSKSLMRERQKSIQLIFQDFAGSMNPLFTVLEVLSEPFLIYFPRLNQEERLQKIKALLEAVDLPSSILLRKSHELSGGQKQRVCIARALAAEPKLLICDESLSALDVSVQSAILNLLHSLQKALKLSLLFISHDLTTVRYLCSDIIVLKKGEIIEHATRQELFSSPNHPYTKQLLLNYL